MLYNAKYDLWVSKDGLVYRYNKKKDKLVLCGFNDILGYKKVCVNGSGQVYVHRIVYETFVGQIPSDYQIDHINTIKDDNRLENLRCVTHKENMNNCITLKHFSDSKKGNTNAIGARSIFGEKFVEHFGFTCYKDPKLYNRELIWYKRHNKVCRWEVDNKCKS